MYTDILDQCSNIAKERGESYWDVKENFQNISDIIESNFWLNMTPSDICKVFIATKIARQKNKHKEDNLLDLVNYYAILTYLMK